MEDFEFIHRAKEFLKEQVKEADKHRSENRWSKKNPEDHKKARKQYERTPKGKGSCVERTMRYRKSDIEINHSEKDSIGEFYLNCPPGYVVDHIHPISKGGKHCLENLQYLTIQQNLKKSAKTREECYEQITSTQMLDLNMEEMREFLTWLFKKISEKRMNQENVLQVTL